MPRPMRSRAAAKRVAAPAPSSELSTEKYDTSDRENEGLPLQPRSRSMISTGTRMSSRQAAALETARKTRDSAMDKLENITSTSANATTADDESDSSDEVEVGRRVAATPMVGRRTEVSGLDLDDDIFDGLNMSLDTAGPASAPRSNEASTVSASHFKRRPRASSFLSRDDGLLRPSSRAGPNTPGISSTFNIGLFRRRAREPSILGTAQKERPERPGPETDGDEQSEGENEEDEASGDESAPDANSTPLRRSKRRPGVSENTETEDASPEPESGNNPRKRKSAENHEQRARSSPYTGSIHIGGDQSDTDSLSEIDSPQLPPPRVRGRPSTPVMDDDIAPPLSSGSSAGEAPIWPPLQSLAKGRAKRPASVLRRTPVREANSSDMSSPPSLTHSPNFPELSPPPQRAAKPARKAPAKQETKMTTADLTDLLPRRRQRNARADPFTMEDSDEEVDTTGLRNDDDELSYLDVRTRRRPARPLSRSGTTKQSATRGRSEQRKAKATPTATKPPRRTYSRTSDKKNQDDEGEDISSPESGENTAESSAEMAAPKGDELDKAAHKFQEVDKWELEYEEMTQSSSPRDAR